MFVLPNEAVREVISGKLNYDDISNPKIERVRGNEIAKGYKFQDQAKVNLKLEKDYTPTCSVLEQNCKKEECVLFKDGNIGELEKAWVCREYKIDFLEAPFDLRYHVSHIGINEIDILETLDNLKNLKEQGAEHICLGCHKVYQNKPYEIYEDGHDGRLLEICKCGNDLFENINNFLQRGEINLEKEETPLKKSEVS